MIEFAFRLKLIDLIDGCSTDKRFYSENYPIDIDLKIRLKTLAFS